MLLLPGCGMSDSGALTEVGKCGNMHFPDSAEVVAHKDDVLFGGDRMIEVVVDLPRNKLESFKTLSHLGQFKPGVPDYWRKQYWQDSAAGALQSDAGNEYFEESDENGGRWVVVHDLAADKTRIFARGLC
ncbi:hypothetical protein [Nocardia sp. NPDC049707]|uniref:hypothetical protein n=1 Tax=Nocardia sp. NPDC049707 TaxID=3154735 RepID=UPI003431EAFB